MRHSISEVAMKFGFSRTTISQVYHEYRESSKTSNLRHHCGRKKIMQERDQRRLTRIIKRNRRVTLPPLLQKRVALSDESRFQLNLADRRVRVWRQPRESMDPTCPQGTIQIGGDFVMVWGLCSWRDMGPLIRLDMTLTSDRYVSILSDHLHPFMSIVHSDGLGEFQQDNATLHTSRIAAEWLQEHSAEFRHFRLATNTSRYEHY
ncbi:transposable element Tcb2 transposase [Trichonephila clavipes]|uniref:Transposable element Tcb2 transposase n=1 Tax=Trichonephila clavipes TaxID=2585209 RepID=A0A8X6RM99_TRICX|nr:transposable element Tcb2 transposase [Trichonephila clavipes]